MIPAEYSDWLDQVAEIPESDLPCNVSTVAYAIKTALLFRAECETLGRVVEELLADA